MRSAQAQCNSLGNKRALGRCTICHRDQNATGTSSSGRRAQYDRCKFATKLMYLQHQVTVLQGLILYCDGLDFQQADLHHILSIVFP